MIRRGSSTLCYLALWADPNAAPGGQSFRSDCASGTGNSHDRLAFRGLCRYAWARRPKPDRRAYRMPIGAVVKCRPFNVHMSLETERLILKAPTTEDVDLVQDYWNLDGPPLTRAQAVSQTRSIMDNHEKDNEGSFLHLCLAVLKKEGGTCIGWCGLAHDMPSLPFPVLFFLLKKAYWGQGFCTEAARAILTFGLFGLGLERIDGACAADNLASRRIMEKIGMKYTGLDSAGGHSFTADRKDHNESEAILSVS